MHYSIEQDCRAIETCLRGIGAAELTEVPCLISATNNRVYRARTTRDTLIVKVVSDTGLDLQHMQRVNDELAARLPMVPLLHVEAPSTSFPCAIVVTRPIGDGQSVADRIEAGTIAESDEVALGRLLARVRKGVESLTLPQPGYGLYKLNRSMADTFAGYEAQYLERYGSRIIETCGDAIWPALVRCLTAAFERVDLNAARMGVFAFDLNLKNVLFDDAGSMWLLNLPILGYGDLRHGVGSALATLGGDVVRSELMRRCAQDDATLVDNADTLRTYEALTLLGVLAGYCHGGASAVAGARTWGYRVPIAERIGQLMS